MSGPSRAERARSFGEVAEDYDRFRPGPPLEAVRWVLGTGRRRAVDLGAGTGGLTRVLTQLSPAVIAIEPDARMAAVLRRRSEGAVVAVALGERIPLAAGSVDAVVASSSWHWMDPDQAGAEVARVLRPGGVFGLLWSGPDRGVPWVAQLLGRPGERGDDAPHRQRRTMVLAPELPFGERETTVLRFHRRFGIEELVGLSGTYSVVILAGAADRANRAAAVAGRVRELFGDGPVEVPMVCRCWRTTRLAGPAD